MVQNVVIIFTSIGMQGGRWSRAVVCFFKMSFIVHCDFVKASQNQDFQSTLLVRRERIFSPFSPFPSIPR